ncbi:hypothetical protein [Couchioplanes azureus]|uniref:hypothetical protein n=1 Tax=Couchioplanes caeruleus TaxID=56438 RepID=UPI0016708276|nr:hypothetical protein [Couchioplanes caeruleus]GGQ78126.1 hypothetical protein GCM10010166_55260 [Couchioplanes caeruleus subsp. azureus]
MTTSAAPAEEWRLWLQARAEETRRRRTAAAAARRDRCRRRAHGLAARHASRLARLHEDTHPFPPDPACSD